MRKTDPFARVEKALSGFRATVEELTAAADHHVTEAQRHQTTAIAANAEHIRHSAAAAEATKIANKIAELLA